MVSVNVSFPDFSAGELSPKMYGRHDLQAYYKGGRRIENFICQVTGPAHYRTGTVYTSKTRDSNKAFLYTFEFTEAVAYILEFTAGYVRFYRNNGQIRYDAQAITGITQANPAVVTYSGADTYANGDRVFIDSVVGMTEINGKEYEVANVDTGANTFELLGIDATGYTAYSSGGTVAEIVEVATPYTEADLFELKFAQQGADLYIAHPDHNPRKLTFTNATSWAMTKHLPFASATQAITNITQANPAVVTYTGDDNFANGDYVIIKDVVGMTEINDAVYLVANVNTGSNTFELSGVNSSAFTAYSSGGIVGKAPEFLETDNYPTAVGFYEQRLIYAGTSNNPNTLWFSVSASTEDFIIGTEVDDGIAYTIAGSANKIIWLRGTSKFLAVGAFSDVYQVTGGIDGVITPTSISIRPSNSYGVANINPIGKGTQIFFPQANQLIMRSFEFDFEQDSYTPVDRNTISDHITASGMTQISFEEGRPNILWCIKTNGVLIGLTVEELESVSGWHRHETDGDYISVASLPRPTQYDQTWFCVKRTIDGTDYHYIEYMVDPVIFPAREDYITDDEEADTSIYKNLMYERQKEYIHLDSSLSYYGDDQTVTMTPGAVTGSAVTFTASGAVFTADMVDREIWRKSVTGMETGRAVIKTFTSSAVVECEIIEDFDSTTVIPAGEWYLTADEVTGAEHLEGKTVSVCVDGAQHPQKTVTNGAITLDQQASVVHIGLPYTGYLETMDFEFGFTSGPSQTKKKSVHAVGFRFLDTLYARFGTSYYKLNTIEMRTAAMKMDRPPEMFTGDLKEIYANESTDSRDGGWQRQKRAIVSQDQPFPCNVQLIIPYMSVSN